MRIGIHPLRSASLSGLLLGFLSIPAAAQTTAPNEWTWMGGSNTVPTRCLSSTLLCGQPGVYGTPLGTPVAGNIPGGRDNAATWTDSSGNLWLFGGEGFDANANFGDLNDLWEFNPSANDWTWMGGSSTLPASCAGSTTVTCGQPGLYGTLITPAAGNVPGGRDYAATWTDTSGNFWLFGGEGFDVNGTFGTLDDLWEFNPTSKVWAWMSGSSTVSGSCTGNDVSGAFYFCVGEPGVYGNLGVSTSGNNPGGRWEPTTWVDAGGQFWLYGGQGFDSKGNYGKLDDLWKFNSTTNEWTWMGGDVTLPAVCGVGIPVEYNALCGWPAVYGALDQPAPNIGPGGRVGALGWTDINGNFWLFGGLSPIYLSLRQFSGTDQYDLWEFNTTTQQWAWMSGNTTSICNMADSSVWCGQDGINGTLGTPSIANIPASRDNANTWIDTNGNFWLFGGYQENATGYDGGGLVSSCSDVWEYNPSANEWALMNVNTEDWANEATTCGGYSGNWGVLGTPAAVNVPSGRYGSASWTDHNGNFWIFGGPSSIYIKDWGWFNTDLNDIWVYQPVPFAPTPSLELIASPNPINIPALGSNAPAITTGTTTVNLVVADGFDSPVTLTASLNTSGGLTGGITGITGSFSPATITGAGSSILTISVTGADVPNGHGDSFPLTVTATGGGISQSIQVIVDVTDMSTFANPIIFSVPAGTYSTPLTVGISGTQLIYYTTNGATPNESSPVYVNPITIASTTTLKAIQIDPFFDQSAVSIATYTIVPPAATPTFSVAQGTYTSAQSITINDTTPNATIYYAINGTPTTGSPQYGGAISVSSSETIEAIAVATNYSQSAVATAAYTIETPAATPTFSIAGGTYASTQMVSLSDSTTGALIYYTTDGVTTPSINATLFNSGTPILVSSTETIQAIVVAPGFSNSAVASATYTIPPGFNVGASPVTVTAGATSGNTSTITLTPIGGFTGNVTLTAAISSGPSGGSPPTFSFGSTSPVTLAGTAAKKATLTIATTATQSHGGCAAENRMRQGVPWYAGDGAALACAMLLGIPARRRSWRTMLALSLFFIAFAAGLTACGGSGGAGCNAVPLSGTLPGDYTITVTATSGSLSHTTTFTLAVN